MIIKLTLAIREYDAETGMYYLNARMYDPSTARFLQEDTYSGDVSDPLSLNLYVYCANNPLVYYDPTGHFWKELWDDTKGVADSAWEGTKGAASTAWGATKGAAEGVYDVGDRLATGVVDTAKTTYDFYTNDPIGQIKQAGEAVGWALSNEENRNIVWNQVKEDTGKAKEAISNYTSTKYEEFKAGDAETRTRMITNVVGETALLVVPATKIGKLSYLSKAEKTTEVINVVNKVDKAADIVRTVDKSNESIRMIDNLKAATTNFGADFANATKVQFGRLLTDETGATRFGKTLELNDFSKLNYKATSGVDLVSTPGKTTTILGTYTQDTGSIVNELGNIKSTNFGPRQNGFNLLNVPDDLYKSPRQFWDEFNKPWLNNAIARDDIILMATKPEFKIGSLFRKNSFGKLELSGFGKEYSYLRKNKYIFDSAANQMIRK